MSRLLIGEVAKRVGITPQAVRYYEQLGLLAPPERSPSGYRRYDKTTLEELAFIKRAQAIGFSLDEIREVVQLAHGGTPPCGRVLDLARQHIRELSIRIGHMTRLRDELCVAVGRWQDGGTPENCARDMCGLISSASGPPQRTTQLISQSRKRV